ncbi:FAD-dependent oxidoreductase [Sulfurisphaera ohwakuensis]|uniref:FAD-dependent oxidoreductase n=1 Tax=Sulfurisphaera ohwakuensis TaxID=69656 RepID=UPI0036F1C6FC
MKVGIVGGGIVGLFTAYYLLKEEAEVTIFEKDFLGSGSIHAAGLIEPYRFDRINTTGMIIKMLKYMSKRVTSLKSLNKAWVIELFKNLDKEPPSEAWETMREMALFSLKEYKRLAEEKNDFDYEESGLLEIYSDEKEFEKGIIEEKKSPFRPKFEIMEIKGFAGGIYFPELSKVDTHKFIDRITKEIKDAKVVNVSVDKVSKDGKVYYAGKEEKFDKVVLSAGVWLKNIGLPITAFKGYGYRVKGEMKVNYPSVLAELGVAVVKNSDFIKITGGFDGDFSTDSSRAEIFLNYAKSLVNISYVYDLYMGYRPCSPDGFPVIGKIGNVVISTGACRLGWSYAPSMGNMTSDLVLDRKNEFGYLSRFIGGRNLSL